MTRYAYQDEQGGAGVQVNEIGFLFLWMLRNGLIDEPALKSLKEEFGSPQRTRGAILVRSTVDSGYRVWSYDGNESGLASLGSCAPNTTMLIEASAADLRPS